MQMDDKNRAKMNANVKTNSLKAWILAARPKTLSAAAVPVMIGVAFALRKCAGGHFDWTPALLCLLFAWVMQIDSNFVNDYFDFKHGNDDSETRLGPKRACTEGWVTPTAMMWAIGITTLLGCLIGIPLIIYGGMEMVLVGMACVAFCFLYTTTLSYLGLGDVLVLLFFGIVPVCCTYYVCMPYPVQMPTLEVFLASVACGLVIDTLLMVNNFRDRENDRRCGKMTLVVRLGDRGSKWLYQHLGFFGVLIMCIVTFNDLWDEDSVLPVYLLYAVYVLLHGKTYRAMFRIDRGRGLNKVLGMTARNILVFGITAAAAILSLLLLHE